MVCVRVESMSVIDVFALRRMKKKHLQNIFTEYKKLDLQMSRLSFSDSTNLTQPAFLYLGEP